MTVPAAHYVHTAGGRLASTTGRDLTRLFAALRAGPQPGTLVLYFHGGMVPAPQALGTAAALLPELRAAQAYPVFFIWESGLLETLRNNLPEIFGDTLFTTALEYLLQLLTGSHAPAPRPALLSAAAAPPPLRPADLAGLAARLRSDPLLQARAAQVAAQVYPPGFGALRAAEAGVPASAAGGRAVPSPPVLRPSPLPAATAAQILTRGALAVMSQGIVIVLQRVLTRLASGRDHGLYPTLVEEVLRQFYLTAAGQAVWELMKKDAADAFRPGWEYGGTAFLRRLRSHWLAGFRPRLVLVGHSAGAIYICRFLQAAQALLPPAAVFDVILLAPGASCSLFTATLQAAAGRIAHLRLFGLADPYECADPLLPAFPALYPRSLLYFVSGVLEPEAGQPLLGLQRCFNPAGPYAALPAVAAARRYLAADPQRLVWGVCDGGPGLASHAAHHADFDDEPFTLASLKHLVQYGFE